MQIEIARKWLKQALHDKELAKRNIGIGGFDISSFLSQQAVEKLLKAIIAFEGEKIPRTHYLDELGNQLELSQELTTYLIELAGDYMITRYPDVSEEVPYELYNEQIAKSKLKTADMIFEILHPRYKGILGDSK